MILKLNMECSNKLYMKGIIMDKFCVKCNAKIAKSTLGPECA